MKLGIDYLVLLLENPVANQIGKWLDGRYCVSFTTGKGGDYHGAVPLAALRRGYDVHTWAPHTHLAYPTKWEGRAGKAMAELVRAPDGDRLELRETRPDQELLSPLAWWLFAVIEPATVVACYDKDGRYLTGWTPRPLQPGELDVDYWNALGCSLPEGAHIFRVGDERFPHDDFLSDVTKEGFANERALEQTLTQMTTRCPSTYNW